MKPFITSMTVVRKFLPSESEISPPSSTGAGCHWYQRSVVSCFSAFDHSHGPASCTQAPHVHTDPSHQCRTNTPLHRLARSTSFDNETHFQAVSFPRVMQRPSVSDLSRFSRRTANQFVSHKPSPPNMFSPSAEPAAQIYGAALLFSPKGKKARKKRCVVIDDTVKNGSLTRAHALARREHFLMTET